jgi:hypothetical protein
MMRKKRGKRDWKYTLLCHVKRGWEMGESIMKTKRGERERERERERRRIFVSKPP